MTEHDPDRGEMESGRPPFVRLRAQPTGTQTVIVVVMSVAIVVATSFAAHDGKATGVERSVLRWINGWPDVYEPMMWVVQQAGVILAPLVVGTLVAIAGRRWTLVIPFALILPVKLLVEKAVVKALVERQRPYVSSGIELNVRGSARYGLSFPSGHTTTALAIAVLLAALLPRVLRLVPIAWAVFVGVARMYMGEHNLYDVVCGAAIGTLFGTVLWFAVLANDHIGGPAIPDAPNEQQRGDSSTPR